MQPKKTPKADLKGNRSLFFQIGLCVSLFAAILFFTWSQPAVSVQVIDLSAPIDYVVEMPPITTPPQSDPAPSAPKIAQMVDVINIVRNEVKIKEIIDPFDLDSDTPYGTEGFEGTGTATGMEGDTADEPIPFMLIQDPPLFQGKDITAFRVWVSENLHYPELAKENGISGRVFIQFVIDVNGNLVDVEVTGGSSDRSLSEEAIRILNMSPQWTPGKQRGRPVPVRYTIPVDFHLQ